MENKRFFTYTAIAACMICAIAVAFNVFTDFELPGRIMAAILGVAITLKLADMRHCCSWVDFTRKHGTDALFRITLGDFWT